MAYDAPIHDALMERVRALDARPDLPEARRGTVDDVLAYDAWCGRERQRVGAFLDAASAVEEARGDLEAEASMRSMAAERLPGWEGLRADEQGILAEANAIREETPARELAAHLAAFGAGPDAIGEQERTIREQVARDAQASEAESHRRLLEHFHARMDAAREGGALTGRLRDCLRERETVEAGGVRFTRREGYADWRSRAETLLAEANRHLDAVEKLEPRPENDPAPDPLRTVSAKLDRSLREDSAELERIRRERSEEKTRQRDRSQDRGFSW